jgi:hypothetical protein
MMRTVAPLKGWLPAAADDPPVLAAGEAVHAGANNRTARLKAIVFQFNSREGHSLAMCDKPNPRERAFIIFF